MLLLYCMAEKEGAATAPPSGVRSAPVEVLSQGALLCYFSHFDSFSGGSAEELKKDALDFHWTVNHIFQDQTVIPFRFPTLLKETSDVGSFLTMNSDAYLADLRRLRGLVQMEVRLAQSAPEAPTSGTGTAYLKAKFDAAQKVIELEGLMKTAAQADWKQRAHRYFALIPRGAVTEFRDKISDLGQATLRVSGPWPPTEFVNCYPEVPNDPDGRKND